RSGDYACRCLTGVPAFFSHLLGGFFAMPSLRAIHLSFLSTCFPPQNNFAFFFKLFLFSQPNNGNQS
ncbi:MAG: hypothetical protein FWE85_03705, partial [Clostridiales bacterium]|nr:hypothetical protein [Clostridiales bacterium]